MLLSLLLLALCIISFFYQTLPAIDLTIGDFVVIDDDEEEEGVYNEIVVYTD